MLIARLNRYTLHGKVGKVREAITHDSSFIALLTKLARTHKADLHQAAIKFGDSSLIFDCGNRILKVTAADHGIRNIPSTIKEACLTLMPIRPDGGAATPIYHSSNGILFEVAMYPKIEVVKIHTEDMRHPIICD